MGPDFILKKDNLLTRKECSELIKWVSDNKSVNPDKNKDDFTGYDYCDLMDIGQNFEQCFSPSPLRPLYNAIRNLTDSYVKKFPELDNIDRWAIQYVRFKHWEPGHSYFEWHSEHGVSDTMSYRVLSFLIYLSDNDCSTHFRRHRSVRTKAGRGIIFPAYFTHEHKGSVCKKGLDRFVAGGFFTFV